MMSDTNHPVGTDAMFAATGGSYVDWPAILAGGVFALAASVLLMTFGAGLGLSLTSPYRGEGASAAWVAIAAGIWTAWVIVSGFGAGGYLAGRLRRKAGDSKPDEVEARDAAHGLIVWATGVLVGAILAAMGVGGLLAAGTSAVGTATELATEAASSDYFANLMLRAEPDGSATSGTGEEGTALPAGPAAQGQDAGIDPAVQQQIAAIITRSAVNGIMAERDTEYLAGVVAANSGLDPMAARAWVDAVNAEIAEARSQALAAVEKARVAGIVFGFIAAATLLIGAIAAAFAAAAGGRHRDAGLGFALGASRVAHPAPRAPFPKG